MALSACLRKATKYERESAGIAMRVHEVDEIVPTCPLYLKSIAALLNTFSHKFAEVYTVLKLEKTKCESHTISQNKNITH